MVPITFEIDGTHFIVDTEAKKSGLLRQNAMTTYQLTRPYMIEAREFSLDEKPKPILFYHVCCEDYGWVQVSTELGNEIIRKCTPIIRFPVSNVILASIASSIISGIMIIRWMKTKK